MCVCVFECNEVKMLNVSTRIFHDSKSTENCFLYSLLCLLTTSSCCSISVFWGSVIVCMCAPVCQIFVLGGPVFIVRSVTLCLRELRLQALFQAEQECPPHYSGHD